jgi:large subunit ribosomal protein L1
MSFSEDQIVGNIRALFDAVVRAKPSGAKGTYIKKVSLTSTMGPGLSIDPSSMSEG